MTKKIVREKKESAASESFKTELENAVENLVFMSETDAPMKPFSINGSDSSSIKESVAEFDGFEFGEAIEERGFEELFARLTRVHVGANEVSVRRAERFLRLKSLLAANLTNLTVVRIGTIRINVYIVGRDGSGKILGIKTFAVET